jgi:peptidylprolyl isomerase
MLKEGNGVKPKTGQKVTVHCTGYGKNNDLNAKFWSTKDPGQQPFTFEIGRGSVIKAWDEGVAQLSLGAQARIKASPEAAYGSGGFPSWGIMPNATLIFEIEVLKIQ